MFQETAYGAAVSSALNSTPSTKNLTPTTPTLSEAVAEIVVVPYTVAPLTGVPDPTGQTFTWDFDGPDTVWAFDLNKVTPPGLLDHTVTAYVSPNPLYRD